MKRVISLIIALAFVAGIVVHAAEIPYESTPIMSDKQAVEVTETLIADILDEVASGIIGYGIASSEADKRIRKAVMADETGGYGYGVLSAIANNAILYERDRLLRPEVYAKCEEYLKPLLADLIFDVSNGRDMENAREEAYIRIYQATNPSYTPREVGMDFCYMDMPIVDMAMWRVARRLLNKNIS